MRSRLALLVLSALASVSHAQEIAPDLYRMSLEDVLQIEVVTATRHSQSLADVPATVYVVTREDIDTYGYRDLADALKHVPGVEISDPHFFLFGGQRGFSGNFSQTLLMINGREMQNLLAGEAFISNQFRTHNVERIEIVMGPASALYGANAFVGVINIITRLQTNWRGTEVGLMAGAFNTYSGDFTHAATFGEEGRIAVSAALYSSDGEDFSDFINTPALYARGNPAIASGQRRLPRDNPLYPFENPARAAVGSLYFSFGRVYGGAEYYDNQNAGGLESVAFVSPTRNDERRLFSHFVGLKSEEQPLAWSLDIEHTTENIESRFPGDYDPNTPNAGPLFSGNFFAKDSERWRLTPQLSYSWTANDNLIAGLRYEKLDIGKVGVCLVPGTCTFFFADKPFLLDHEKRSAYAQLQLGFLAQDRLQLTLGARYDDHNLYGETFNPRAGVVFKPYAGGTLKFLYGTAFREPNVFELTRNANLRPMNMTTYELSFLHQSRYFSNQLVYFLNEARDIFNEVPTVGGGSLFTNAGARNVHGIEDTFKLQWQRWNVTANVAWEDPSDEVVTVATGTQVADALEVSKLKANLLLDYTLPNNITVAVLNHYVDKVETLTLDMAGNRELATIPAFWETDLTISRRGLHLAPGLAVDVSVSVRNLFDADIYHPQVRDVSPLQFKQNGRFVFLTIRARY